MPAHQASHLRSFCTASKREGDVRLYLFEHCSLCFRVRMVAALKRLHLQEMVESHA
jgi:hypothetical protein